MKKQSGFTLIELAIVLVIIGLLLGGVLKGQELINSAKVKNMAGELKNVQLYLNLYQDKFRAIPGDDKSAVANVGTATVTPVAGDGNGSLEGAWSATTGETFQVWQHIRLAGLAAGTTTTTLSSYLPTNNEGGPMGVQSNPQNTITGLTGSYVVCSGGITGKLAKQIDILLDDGDTTKGAVMVAAAVTGTSGTAPVAITVAGFDSTKYVLCLAF